MAPLFPSPPAREVITAEQPRLPLAYYQEQVQAPAGPHGGAWTADVRYEADVRPPERGRLELAVSTGGCGEQGWSAQRVGGYPMITLPGQDITWGEFHVGSRGIFADAGFAEVSRPTRRRVVMRIDF